MWHRGVLLPWEARGSPNGVLSSREEGVGCESLGPAAREGESGDSLQQGVCAGGEGLELDSPGEN